jgi:hypothetical protein
MDGERPQFLRVKMPHPHRDLAHLPQGLPAINPISDILFAVEPGHVRRHETDREEENSEATKVNLGIK